MQVETPLVSGKQCSAGVHSALGFSGSHPVTTVVLVVDEVLLVVEEVVDEEVLLVVEEVVDEEVLLVVDDVVDEEVLLVVDEVVPVVDEEVVPVEEVVPLVVFPPPSPVIVWLAVVSLVSLFVDAVCPAPSPPSPPSPLLLPLMISAPFAQ